MKYINYIRELLTKLPKDVLVILIIILGGAVAWFARSWYMDYTVRQDQGMRNDSIMIQKLESLEFSQSENRERIDYNTSINSMIFEVVHDNSMRVIKLEQKVDAVARGNTQLQESFDEIERANEQYQEQLDRERKMALPPADSRNIILPSDNADSTLLVTNDEDERVKSKFLLIFKRLMLQVLHEVLQVLLPQDTERRSNMFHH